ncbi:glycosyltransferase family 2 protein [Patescibacteria group bacterium]|nr:glycosyltransferase family 2 protein [Patescibacteria group bacterium]
MTSVAIIIVHFNTDDETKACLESLIDVKHKGISLSTFVIDNGSKNPLHVPERLLTKTTRIIRSDANLGFTNGNNLGISVAIREVEPDYILLLNNDTTVKPDFLEKLVLAAQAEPKLGMAVPKIYFYPGKEFHSKSYPAAERGRILWFAGGTIDWANLDAFHRGVDEIDRGQFDHTSSTEFATGCCILIPRAVLERVGTLDPRYFLYLEDVDWSQRVIHAGYDIKFVPESVVWHKNAGSSGGAGSPTHLYYQTRNRLFFFMKYAQHHFLTSQQGSLAQTTQLFWFYLRVIRLAMQKLFQSDNSVRRGALDWFLGRMGKQAVY